MSAILPTEIPEKMPSIQSPGTKSILVVDDELPFARFVESLFVDHGYRVRVAGDAEEALRLACEEPPDLITLDLMMPGKTGIMLYRDLRKQDELKGTRIVILTGLDHMNIGRCSYRRFFKTVSRAGNVPEPEAYLTKPIEPAELLKSVRRALQ